MTLDFVSEPLELRLLASAFQILSPDVIARLLLRTKSGFNLLIALTDCRALLRTYFQNLQHYLSSLYVRTYVVVHTLLLSSMTSKLRL